MKKILMVLSVMAFAAFVSAAAVIVLTPQQVADVIAKSAEQVKNAATETVKYESAGDSLAANAKSTAVPQPVRFKAAQGKVKTNKTKIMKTMGVKAESAGNTIGAVKRPQ